MYLWTLQTTQGDGSKTITNGHPKAEIYGGTFSYYGLYTNGLDPDTYVYSVCSLFEPEIDGSGVVWVQNSPVNLSPQPEPGDLSGHPITTCAGEPDPVPYVPVTVENATGTKDFLTLNEQTLTPTTPTADKYRLYVKDDGLLYIVDDAGVETAVGAGGATGVFSYKGAINASTNPNYPAGDSGDVYKISVAGKIGGASGVTVEVGDLILCLVDGSISGNQATVGANWSIIQTNIVDVVTKDATQILTNKELTSPILTSPSMTGTPTAPTAVIGTNTSQVSTTAFVIAEVLARIASLDVAVHKGVIDCSANPNYPAADAGHVYRVSVAGKIGGASGVNVENGDMLICQTDGSAAGTQAAVGANWGIIQTNTDGTVTLTGAQNLQDKTLTSPIINVGSDAGGDIYYRSAGGLFTRLGIGSAGQVLTVAAGLPSWATAASASPGGSTTQLQYNNAGAFGGVSGVTSNGTNMTFGSGNLIATRPKFITSVDDTNGNEIFEVGATASAVNQLKFTNAATGNAPIISATGGDTNIGLNIKSKGTGAIRTTGSINVYATDDATLLWAVNGATGMTTFTYGLTMSGANLTMSGTQLVSTGNGYGLQLAGGNYILSSTTLTPDSSYLACGATSNAWHLAEIGDYLYDFQNGNWGTSAATSPSLIIHSQNQSTTQYLSLFHDGTDANIYSGLGAVKFSSVIRLKTYTVAGLPTGTIGDVAYVSDQLTTVAAKGVAPTGGGSVKCVVFYNGSDWVGI